MNGDYQGQRSGDYSVEAQQRGLVSGQAMRFATGREVVEAEIAELRRVGNRVGPDVAQNRGFVVEYDLSVLGKTKPRPKH